MIAGLSAWFERVDPVVVFHSKSGTRILPDHSGAFRYASGVGNVHVHAPAPRDAGTGSFGGSVAIELCEGRDTSSSHTNCTVLDGRRFVREHWTIEDPRAPGTHFLHSWLCKRFISSA